jgi:hypothetical protein
VSTCQTTVAMILATTHVSSPYRMPLHERNRQSDSSSSVMTAARAWVSLSALFFSDPLASGPLWILRPLHFSSVCRPHDLCVGHQIQSLPSFNF